MHHASLRAENVFMCANHQSLFHFWCGYGVLDTEGKFAAFLLGPASRNVTNMPNLYTPDALPVSPLIRRHILVFKKWKIK